MSSQDRNTCSGFRLFMFKGRHLWRSASRIRLRLLIFYYANPNWTVQIHFGPVTSTQGSWDITQNSLLTDASAYTQRETHTTCAQHVNATVRAELLIVVQLRHPRVKTRADNVVSNDRKVLLIHRMNVLHLQGFNNLDGWQNDSGILMD